ncbi:hypothetical protein LINGRAHAP2_LOCUS36751 [Linum grandiflorum]
MWMLAKPVGYLLEDIDIDTHHLSASRPAKPHRQPRLLPPPPSVESDHSAASSRISAPISTPTPEVPVPLINELEDMLLVDRKCHRYDDDPNDPMEDIPPKRIRTVVHPRLFSPIPEDDSGRVSFDCENLLDDVPHEGLLVGQLATSSVEEGRREGHPQPP